MGGSYSSSYGNLDPQMRNDCDTVNYPAIANIKGKVGAKATICVPRLEYKYEIKVTFLLLDLNSREYVLTCMP